MGLFYYNLLPSPSGIQVVLRAIFGSAGRSGPVVSCSIRRSWRCGSWRGHLFDQAAFEILKLIPHARAGDENLRFDFAASQADSSSPDEPFGTPLHFSDRGAPNLLTVDPIGEFGQGCAIHNGTPDRDLKTEYVSRQRNVRLPVSEAIFQPNSAGLPNSMRASSPRRLSTSRRTSVSALRQFRVCGKEHSF